MKTRSQDTRPGTENLEEDTCDLPERLTPAKRGGCRGNTKAVCRACVNAWEPQAVTLDERVGVAASRAAYYLLTLPERVAEVKQAAAEVLLTARQQEGRAK
jgi:hypothetical protein